MAHDLILRSVGQVSDLPPAGHRPAPRYPSSWITAPLFLGCFFSCLCSHRESRFAGVVIELDGHVAALLAMTMHFFPVFLSSQGQM